MDETRPSNDAPDDIFARIEGALGGLRDQTAEAQKNLGENAEKAQELLSGIVSGIVSRTDAVTTLTEVATAELQALKQSLAERSAMAEQAGTRIRHLEQALAERQAKARDRKLRIAQLEKSLAEQTDAIQAAQGRAAELERSVEERERAARAANEKAADLEEKARALEVHAEETRLSAAEQRRAEQQLEKEQQRSAELEEKVTALEETGREMTRSLEELREAEGQLAAERQRADQLEQCLQDEASKGAQTVIAEQRTQALKDLEAANGEVTSLRAEVDTLRQKVSEQEQPAPPPPPKEEEKPARRSRREREGAPVQVGQILFNGGAISQEQLDYILGEQRKFPQRSQSSIVLENGMASEEVVAQAIASQRQVLFVHLDDDSVDPTATAMLKGRIARNHSCIPVRATEQSLVLAMVDPLDLMAIQDVEQASGRQVQPVVAMASEIATAIEKHYSESEA